MQALVSSTASLRLASLTFWHACLKLCRFFTVLMLLAFSGVPGVAQATGSQSSLAVSSADVKPAYLLDPSGQLALDAVKSSVFEPFGGKASFGYTVVTLWLKLRIDPARLTAGESARLNEKQLVLRLTNPLLDDVRLYDPLINDNLPVISGDQHASSPIELGLSSLTFLLPVGDEPRDVYISVRTSSSMVFTMVLGSVEQALRSNRIYDLFSGIYLGLLVVFLVLAIALGIGRDDLVSRLFILQQVLAIAWSVSLMGYTRQYIGPLLGLASVDFLVNLVIVSYTFAVCQFVMVFLRQFHLRRLAQHLVYLPIVIFVPLLLAVVFGYPRLALGLNALAVIALSILFMLMAVFAIDWKASKESALPRWLVTTFFVTVGFASPLATSVTLRVEPMFQNAFVGFFFTTALAGLLMSTLLLARARNMTRVAIASALALDLQQQRNQEQARFLGMLAHEFKTPLSIIKMVVGSGQLDTRSSGYSEDAIRNIDALLDKCLQAETLLDAPHITESITLDVDVLIREVVQSSSKPNAITVRASGRALVRSDPTLVRIILANLVDNAHKYSQPDSTVEVLISGAADERLTVRVTNTIGTSGGPEAARVFEKYYRTAGAMSQSGSGLGLYLSRHIARLLGGDLRYLSEGRLIHFDLVLLREINDP